ncbi:MULTISPECIES: bacillithiol biosynthesis cysteine-adding enzyme BshC [unclassified Arcicella]|uniref:bacillithiol biosynthesis cysteine-adding enzyme BshC n=1 Tax=unclassified Arcicella TaxID=2644986 RepID=UPI00285DACCF|nr:MULTISPECIES: bacillithiol biosynthesis cysteine-adding enzyme BshC [unclassified Arcicella]MDR6564727.1 bacillithiol biosynthesis cysteine-adding enzyme BshC [Arcicella sp. BE51]MDR6814523.1 bacillithiol biosynthesis cysteine-adding enzyme BshC [Arcicella sp. BE140]MDR6825889.1 bacillithiol biosynthesis cysteine-adding enzyme BshC [Arcicella sp. BE139]
MQIHQLPLEDVNQFSSLFLDFINQSTKTKDFYENYPDLKGFEQQIALKQFDSAKRSILVETLKKQYSGISNKPNVDILLEENTFTVTTGHQLNIFTGPLYVIYKLVTTINLAKSLKNAFPAYNFVPVYWMATEDHDFAEINHFSLFGKKLAWETVQKGAVGRMNPKELEALITEMAECPAIFKDAYLNNETLANAARCYANDLFGDQGLICIDADDRNLKKLFAPIIKNDLLHHTAFDVVSKTSEKLESLGYKTQISPREINFFYLENGLRERIVKEGDTYKVLNTSLQFSETEILNLLETEPEKFSPNVVLRPVYEEVILPNLAYIGGPSEVPYWLQLKGIFDFHQVAFPILMPRNFCLIVNKATAKRMEKLDLTSQDLFLDEISLKKSFIEKHSENSLSLATESNSFVQVFEEILTKAVKIDKTLEGAVKGEQQKVLNALENLEKRLKKAEERNHETEVNQLLGVKQKLFPNGTPQERSENFLNFYLNNPEFLTQISAVFDPLNFKFYIIIEE